MAVQPKDEFTTDASGLMELHKTKLAIDFPGKTFIKVIDNLFTAEECAALIQLAESGSESGESSKWEPAKITTSHGEYVNTDYRNSGRILRFDEDAARKMFERLKPHIEEVLEISEGSEWSSVAAAPRCVRGVWKCVGLNERLSFLRYGPGHYFKPHNDGLLTLPDGRKSRVTVQIYLNDTASDGLTGGATRIFGNKNRYIDVHPKLGRALIFQQRGVYHSGEEVEKGLKFTMRSDLMYKNVDEQE